MRIAVFGSRHQDNYIEKIAGLFGMLAGRGIGVEVDEAFWNYLSSRSSGIVAGRVFPGNDFAADLAVSIGGDGTFLRTASRIGEKCIPIVGVNTGRLGYLTEVMLDDFGSFLDEYEAGECRVEKRSLIKVDVPDGIALPKRYALNEVAVQKNTSASMLEMRTRLDGVELTAYLGDGLIVSTPTGSTAYNLSVGGPILRPGCDCFVISPIAAHSLTMRPLVIPDGLKIEVTVNGRSQQFRLSVDGYSVPLPMGSKIALSKAAHEISLVQRKGHNFAEVLRAKLMWGADVR